MSFPLYTASKYFPYWINALGPHGLHSPLLYDLYQTAIKHSNKLDVEIEEIRKRIYQDKRVIDVTDLKTGVSKRSSVGDYARRSASRARFSKFLQLLCEKLEIRSVLETGTSLGINALYLAGANTVDKVCSIEGSRIIYDLAKKVTVNDPKVELLNGDLHDLLEMSLVKYQPQLVFLDADHRSSSVEFCVEKVLEHVSDVKCIVIHDIYWSPDMTKAWEEIVGNTKFTLTVDLFQAGLLFPNYPMEKQHFILKF